MATSATQPASPLPSGNIPAPREPHDILPTLFGEGYGTYAVQSKNFYTSFVLHTLALALLLWLTQQVVEHRAQIAQVLGPVVDIGAYIPLPAAAKQTGGGGGGGDRDKLDASKGVPPKFSMQQITPPTVVIRNDAPKLAVEQTVMVPPQVKINQVGPVGSLTSVLNVPSNGTGYGSGIGSGCCGGVGSGSGRGVGPGDTAGIGGGVFQVGGGVAPPRIKFQTEPEFSEEARKAKHQGTVVVRATVGADGKIHDPHVVRSLGLGLDEKAIEAVNQWLFEPAIKDGRKVAVFVDIEVNFRLY
ncbi:MAG TPA: energy transducer TonB [Terriglobales bacterium]|nr:energy transducer TonB [Terriglobales bacterium]